MLFSMRRVNTYIHTSVLFQALGPYTHNTHTKKTHKAHEAHKPDK